MCSDSDSYTAGLCVRPGSPAHLLYGAKFLHLPLYRGDGDSAVEGLLSTQNEQEGCKGKKRKKKTGNGQEKNARKGKKWSQSSEISAKIKNCREVRKISDKKQQHRMSVDNIEGNAGNELSCYRKKKWFTWYQNCKKRIHCWQNKKQLAN